MNTVVELPADMRDPLRQTANKGLMVSFINADLLNRAGLDVRKSIVLYDDAGVFEYALDSLPNTEVLQRLYDQTAIRFYSEGI
jgi:hypothetical protein